MMAVITAQDRDKGLIEGHVEHPVEQENHVAKKHDCVLRVVLAVLQEEVREKDQPDHGQQIANPEDDEEPVEEDGTGVVNGADESAVTADLRDEAQEELIFPLIALLESYANITYTRVEEMAEDLNKHNEYNSEAEKEAYRI